MTYFFCSYYCLTLQHFLFLVPLSPTKFPSPYITFQGGTFATILRHFMLFSVTYVYDLPFTRSPLSIVISLTAPISSPSRPLPMLSTDLLHHRLPPSGTLHCFPVASSFPLWLALLLCFLYLRRFSSLSDCCLPYIAQSFHPPLFSPLMPAFSPSGLALSFDVAFVSVFRLHRSYFSFHLLLALAITGHHCRTIALPLNPLCQTKDTVSKGLPGFFSRFSSQSQPLEVQGRS